MEISTFNKAKNNMSEIRLSETFTRGEAKCNIYDCYFTSKRTKEDYYIEVQTSELNGMNWITVLQAFNESHCEIRTKQQGLKYLETLAK